MRFGDPRDKICQFLRSYFLSTDQKPFCAAHSRLKVLTKNEQRSSIRLKPERFSLVSAPLPPRPPVFY